MTWWGTSRSGAGTKARACAISWAAPGTKRLTWPFSRSSSPRLTVFPGTAFAALKTRRRKKDLRKPKSHTLYMSGTTARKSLSRIKSSRPIGGSMPMTKRTSIPGSNAGMNPLRTGSGRRSPIMPPMTTSGWPAIFSFPRKAPHHLRQSSLTRAAISGMPRRARTSDPCSRISCSSAGGPSSSRFFYRPGKGAMASSSLLFETRIP